MAETNQPAGTAPANTITVPQSQIHFNSAAYPELPNCSASTDWLKIDLNNKTVWGADVAILDLGQPVAVQPKPVLTTPPFGFSPVQDLYGQQVTIIGRGKPSPESDDISIMRFGTSAVDAYRRVRPPECTGQHELVEPFSIQLHNDAGNESMIQGGDSGGPMIASVPGLPGTRVIGVNSAGQNPDEKSFIAPTFVRPNSTFLYSHGVGTTPLADTDGDGVVNPRDNCPLDANTDQN